MGSDRGAPTGLWETKPKQVDRPNQSVDVRKFEARLEVERPDLPKVDVALEKQEFLIGRDVHTVDLVLDDDLVSRCHAKLSFTAQGYVFLHDLDSKNGIQFEGRTVKRLNLVNGDTFTIGHANFRFFANLERYRSQANPVEPENEQLMDNDESILAEDIPVPEVAADSIEPGDE